jgi:hypothetical protein
VYIGGASDSGIVIEKTTNNGGGWSSISNGLSSDSIKCIAIDPAATNTLYAATPDGIYRSTNAGSNWIFCGCTDVTEIVVDPVQHNIIYAGTHNGVFKSTDYGNSWIEMNDGLTSLHIICMDITPDHYLYCGTDSMGTFRWSLAVGVQERSDEPAPAKKHLYAAPNPASDHCTIFFNLSNTTQAELKLYDINGRLVRDLGIKEYPAGEHHIHWDTRDDSGRMMASGIYFVEVRTNTQAHTVKLSLINR